MADRVVPLIDEHGRLVGYQGAARDITDQIRAEEQRERLEGQLQQAQKMEAIGRLAGGVAHDFNNILMVILGCCELGIDGTEPGSTTRWELTQIANAARHAADLTRQLLAFSRRQVVAPGIVDFDRQIGDMEQMLRRTIGEDVELSLRRGAGGSCVT